MLKPAITYKLHIFSLSAFAFAQPLYDLLGKNAAFFTVRNNGVADIIIFTAFLSLLIPTALVFIIESVRLLSKKAWIFFHLFVVTLLVSIITLPILKQIPAINTIFTASFALLFSITFTFFYQKKNVLKLFLTYLSPAALIFPLIFLLNSQVYYLLFPPKLPEIEITSIKSTTPIVMIVFDELPVSTLMSDKYIIDNKLFPGFASLAKTATWYPNTSTVAESTIQAIPALLTGNLPPEKQSDDRPKLNFSDWLDLPSYQYYPRNLFTALNSQYELRVFETVSSLCPTTLCEPTFDFSMNLNLRLDELFNDLFLVYQHTVLPKDITRTLPRIDMNWSDFFVNDIEDFHDNIKENDAASFQRFINSLTPSNKPTLYFHHTTLPHGPWKYLPSGKNYKASSFLHALALNLVWKDDFDLREPYQRHLLQTMFADKLLSDAFNKLKQENIFDNSIIIVTADHGASFRHGEAFRSVGKNNYADIMDVPLFIKYPKQKNPSINVTQLQLIDVIPTLFKALGDKYPWKTDGTAADNKKVQDFEKMPIVQTNGDIKYINHNRNKKFETVEWKKNLIGNNGVNGIYGGPGYHHLIGQRIKTECARTLADIEIINTEKNFTYVMSDSNTIAASIRGTVPKNPLRDTEVLAITLNDNIAAILTSTSVSNDSKYFHTMIDERLVRNGNNHIDIYALEISGECNVHEFFNTSK